jgi:PAS domain S-box-containing protein
MGRPPPVNPQRRSIARQAALRLILSLGLFVVLLGVSSYQLYSIALQKAARERAEDLATFYQARLMQLDRDWELQANDFKVRLEVTRLLEEKKTSVTSLQAFMTMQGINRHFQYLLIQNRLGGRVFNFGTALDLKEIPVPAGQDSGWYLAQGSGNLYRVFVVPIWLGEAETGRMAVFYEIDNSLLFNLATPGIVLTARHDGKPIASSTGQAGLGEAKPPAARTTDAEDREIPWDLNAANKTLLHINAPIKVLFTKTELALGAAMIPIIDGLILWFTLGFWLMRNAHRVRELGGAVEEFVDSHRPTAKLKEKLLLARGEQIDEISEVADAIGDMAEQTLQRERERIEEEARHRLWSMVFANSNEAIIITDRDNHILTANAVFTRMTGYAEDEVVGRNPRTLSSSRQTREFYSEMWRQIEEHGNWSGNMLGQRKDGSVYPTWLNINVVRDSAGNITNYVGSFLDISERKQAEDELRESEARYERAVNGANDGIWEWNVVTGEYYLSPRWKQLLGYEDHELPNVQDSFFNQIHPEDQPRVSEAIRAHFEERKPYEIELRLQCKSGEYRWFYARGKVMRDEQGQPLRMAGSITDITEKKRAEQSLREANQHKDEFLAMLAHELRNPLAPIRNAAQLIGRLGRTDPEIKWAQEVIEGQVVHLARLVDDLLDVSRIARGKITLKQEDIELAMLVEKLMQSIRPLADNKGHHLAVRLPEYPVQLHGDPVRLNQILFNLIDNAIRYTPDGGRIELDAHMAGPEIEISVRDNGMGIRAGLLPRVFDLFQQDERKLDRAQGGLGIGLTLVQHMVEMHGGRVTAYSEGPGLGATLTVWLPAKIMPVLPAALKIVDNISLASGARVLVVDDDFAVADSMAKLLKMTGYAVRVANTGQAALEQIPLFRPQVVLLDIGLKGMDGFETAIRLRELPEGRDIYVIAVTGYADEKTKAQALESGCNHFLAKPVSFAVLNGLLAEVT